MEEKFSLFYDDYCVIEDYTEEELENICKELELEYGWESIGEYHYFLNNHYWCKKNYPFKKFVINFETFLTNRENRI